MTGTGESDESVTATHLITRRRLRWHHALWSLLLVWALFPTVAEAHSALVDSTPAANAVLNTSPGEIRLEFSNDLRPEFSVIQLLDADGRTIQTFPSHAGSDLHELILPLPHQVPDGTYTVQWNIVSADDGHPGAGYFPFTIGTQAPVATANLAVTPPVRQPLISLRSIAVWLDFLGIAGVVGVWLAWWLTIVPGLDPLSTALQQRIAGGIRRLVFAALGVTLVAAGLLVLVDTAVASGSGPLKYCTTIVSGSPNGATSITPWDTLINTWDGRLIAVQLGVLVVLVLLTRPMSTWFGPNTVRRSSTFIVGAVFLLTRALSGHAADQADGRPAAITADWLHLVSASFLIAGPAALVLVLWLARSAGTGTRLTVRSLILPRLVTGVIAALIILGLTGTYLAGLDVGNQVALRGTTYGRALTLKLLLLAIALVMVGSWIIATRMRRAGQRGYALWIPSVVGPTFGAGLLFISAGLISLPTARDVLTFASGHPVFQIEQDGMVATLQLTPGTAGLNRYTVDIEPDAGPLPADAQVVILAAQSEVLDGQREIALQRQPGGNRRYEAVGSDLSVVGDWTLQLRVRQPNQADWHASIPLNVGRTPLVEQAPGLPLRFGGITAAIAMILLALALMLLVVAVRSAASTRQRALLEFGLGLLLIGGVSLPLTRLPGAPSSAGNPIPRSATSVEHGYTLFQEYCVSCHGVDGRGDGPAATNLHPAPADLRATHVDYHDDRQIHLWIKGGVAGSAMPGFEEQLSDDQIWDLVNYVRSLRYPVPSFADTQATID